MVSQRAVLIGLCGLFIVSLSWGIAPAVAMPPPEPLCGACGEGFEEAATRNGVTLTVEHSSATVRVHQNGSATWVVRNSFANPNTTDQFRRNANLLASIAERAMGDTTYRGATLSSNGTIILRYRDSDFATPSTGQTLRSGAFTEAYGYPNLDGLGADQLTVVAPAGMQIEQAARGATVSQTGQQMTLTHLETGSFVTFVPANTPFGPLLSTLAIVSVVGPVVVRNVLTNIVLPTAVYTVLIGSAAVACSNRTVPTQLWSIDGRVALTLLGGLLIIFSVLLALLGFPLFYSGMAALMFGVGCSTLCLGVVLKHRPMRKQTSFRTLIALALLGTVLAAGTAVAIGDVYSQHGLSVAAYTELPFLLPMFMLLPIGYVARCGRDRLSLGTLALSFGLALVPWTPLTAPRLSTAFGVVFIFFTGLVTTITIGVVGLPYFVMGAMIATEYRHESD